MKRLFFALTLISSSLWANDITVELQLKPKRVLAGLPVAFVVTFHNANAAPVTIGNGYEVEFAQSSGEKFLAFFGEAASFPVDNVKEPSASSSALTIPANSKLDFYLSATGEGSGNPAFNDPRLSVPGEYRIQIHLTALAASSNVATLTVVQPVGEDANVLEALKKLTERPWTIGVCAELVLECAATVPRTSEYNLAVAMQRPYGDGLARASALVQAAETAPDGYREEFAIGAAGDLVGFGGSEFLRGEIETAASAYQRAERALEVAGTDLPTPLQSRVNWLRTQLRTRQQLEKDVQDLRDATGSSKVKVKGFAKCVEERGEKRFIRFGYENPSEGSVIIPIGVENKLTPAPQDQGQPKVFESGRVENAFSAEVPGEGNQVIWHLNGERVVGTRSSLPLCE